jgi:hypothetical protein
MSGLKTGWSVRKDQRFQEEFLRGGDGTQIEQEVEEVEDLWTIRRTADAGARKGV